MLPKRSHKRFLHRVDIYSKTSEENDTGQLKATWTIYQQRVPVSYTPSFSSTSIRNTPTTEESDWYTLIFPHDAAISYGHRLKNLVTMDGEFIEKEYMQVMEIKKHISYTGKIQFIEVRTKSVIE